MFSVGGRQVAARTEEIAGVRPWPEAMPVPSNTPFVTSLIRIDKECLPVYDLAAKLNGRINPVGALCLIIKHEDGPLAVCIDPSIPSLHMVDSSTIQERPSDESDIVGICSVGDEQLSIIHLARLGKGALAEGSGYHSHV
ncbi:chemotaxis protein CheW [Nitrospira sp. Nam80]